MSIPSLLEARFGDARQRDRALIVELGLKTDRQLTLAVTGIEDGVIHGHLVLPSLTDRWLPEKPSFRLSERKLPVALEAASIYSLMSLAVKPKALDPELRKRLEDVLP